MNRVYVSPFQIGFVHGWESLLNENIFTKEGQEQIDLQKMFFNFLIQSGAQEILLLGSNNYLFKKDSPSPPNIISRIKFLKNYNDIKNKIKIKEFLIENLKSKNYIKKKETQSFIDVLSYDLGSMIFCADNRLGYCSSTFAKINQRKLYDFFKMETANPLFHLLKSLKNSQFSSTEYKFSTSQRDIKIIEEILKSNHYTYLSNAHLKLRNSKENLQNTKNDIEKLADDLKKNYDSKLKLKKGVLLTLDFGKKITDIFGDFVGSISDSLYSQIKKIVEKENRLVIYDSRKLLSEIASIRMKDYLDKIQHNAIKK